MIRKATPADAKSVAPLIIQAMGELAFKFSNNTDLKATTSLFEFFFGQKNNQYSYENTLVYEEEAEVLGSINAYDGANLLMLRENFLSYLNKNNNLKHFHPEPETESGEFYLDTISVNAKRQGMGIGKQLIDAGVEWARLLGHKKVGLLVEINNSKALKLYQQKGFKIMDQKKFAGALYYHLVYNII